MNDKSDIKVNMCTLIKKYIEALNPIVTTEIKTFTINGENADSMVLPDRCKELGITNNSFLLKQEELENLNKSLNEETLSSSKLKLGGDFKKIEYKNNDDGNTSFANFEEFRYLNYLEINKGEYLLFYLTLAGFEDDTKDRYLNNPYFSFLKYVIDYIFRKCNSLEINQIFEQNIDDSISSIGRDFINSLINYVCNEGGNEKANLHDEFNFISTLNYEGQSISAKLLLIDEKLIEQHVNFVIKFDDLIAYKEHRKIRKLLEMTDESIHLIGDNKNIYGLGNLRNLHNLKEDGTNKVLLIDFIGRFEYKIKKIKIIHDIKVGKTGRDEIVNWFYKENNILSVKYGKMELVENTFSEIRLRESLQNVFYKYLSEEENVHSEKIDEKITNIIEIVKCAYKQKHGTTLVITTPKIAKTEVQRLKEQSIKIDVINIKESMYYKQVVEKITNIDGALYMDINGYVHAIGVILDGYAEAGSGDSARGARYNSAIRYKNGKDINGKCVIIVISEDGMIDIIPDSEIEKQISELVRQINDLYKNKNFQEALDLVETLETLNPKRPETYYSKALILKRMRNRQEESLDAVTYAIQLKEDYQVAYNLRGGLYNKMKQPEKALNDFEKSLKIGPSYIAYLNMGNILAEFERFDEAIISFSKAIERNSRIPTAYDGRMAAYVGNDEFEKALEDAKTLLKIKENDPFLLGIQGNLYRILKDNEKAIDSLKKSIHEYKKDLDGNNDMEVYKNLVDLCRDILGCNLSEEEKEEFQQLLKGYKKKLVELEDKEN